MKMQCPHCGVKGSLNDSYAGRKMRCPKCAGMFIAEKEQALDEVVAQGPTDQVMDLTDSREDMIAETGLLKKESEKTLAEADAPGEMTQELIAEEDLNIVDEFDAEAISENDRGNMMDYDPLTNDESANDIFLDDSLNDVPEQKLTISDKPAEDDPDSVENEMASPAVTEKHVCGCCSKVAANTEKYIELDGKFYCPLCGPAVEDELLTSAQAAAAVAAKTGPENNEVAYLSEVDQPGEWENFTVGEALSRAWKMTSGVKLAMWGGLTVTSIVMVVLMAVLAMLMAFASPELAVVIALVGQFAYYIISTVLTAGLLYMGVRRAERKRVSWKDVFSGFDVAVKITVAMILQTILITVGMFLLILPGIYLMVGYFMTLPLIIDQKMSPWQAMEVSRKAIHKVWWKVFGLYLLVSLIIVISSIPLGIGLIWTLPMSLILAGVVYRYLFPEEKIAD